MTAQNFLASIFPLVPQRCVADPTVCGWSDFNGFIANLFNLLLWVPIPIVTLVSMYGGFLMITSGGDEGKFKKGKNAIFAAVIGAAIVYGAEIIYSLVKGGLLGTLGS